MNKASDVRIVLADHQRIFRAGLKWLLESEQGFVVVGEAGSCDQALRMVRNLTPDVVLLDLMLPGGGLHLLKKLTTLPQPVHTIALTASVETDMLVEALQHGARGVILKDTTTALLFKSIRAVFEDQYWVSRQEIGGIIETMRRLNEQRLVALNAKRFKLTPREMDIVTAVAAGESNKGIAERLKLSPDTVKHHVSSVFDKVGVFSRLELAVFAINHNLVKDPSDTASAAGALTVKTETPPPMVNPVINPGQAGASRLCIFPQSDLPNMGAASSAGTARGS